MNPTYKEDKNKFYSYIDKQDINAIKQFMLTHKIEYDSIIEDGFERALDYDFDNVINFFLQDPNFINHSTFNLILLKGNENYFNKSSFFLNNIQNFSEEQKRVILSSSVQGENLNILKQLIECIDPRIDSSSALQMAIFNQYKEGIDLLLPHSDYNVVLTNTVLYDPEHQLLQQCVDEYEAVQQQKRLNDQLTDIIDIKSNSKRKM